MFAKFKGLFSGPQVPADSRTANASPSPAPAPAPDPAPAPSKVRLLVKNVCITTDLKDTGLFYTLINFHASKQHATG